MKNILIILILLALIYNCKNNTNMDNNFSPYPRVRQAYGEKIDIIKSLLSDKNIDTSSLNIFIRAFKTEQKLELWGKNTTDEQYRLVHTYDVCKISGKLGPKRKEGDFMAPEGA